MFLGDQIQVTVRLQGEPKVTVTFVYFVKKVNNVCVFLLESKKYSYPEESQYYQSDRVYTIKKMKQFTLMIKFTATKENHLQFKEELLKLFAIIEGEDNFVSSILHQNLQKEEEYLVYEVWNDNTEHFMNVQMKKPFVLEWEQLLVDMNIQRDPAVYHPIGKFGAAK